MYNEIMKMMNKLHRNGVETINREDVKDLFGYDLDFIQSCFDYLGIEYVRVADLFNVTVRYFTKEEQNKIKFYASLI